MDIQAYRDEIILKILGDGILESEIEDSTIDKVINNALREIQRYIDTTAIMTVPYKPCIDLSQYHINSVVRIMRANSFIASTCNNQTGSNVDPLYAMQWQMYSGMGNMQNFQNGLYNFLSWNTMLQIRNTTSTDLNFYYDSIKKQLYVNIADGNPGNITILFIPRFQDVSEIQSDYWIDKIMLLSVALTKVVIGRIRSKFKLNNAQYELDGERLVQEGNEELTQIRAELVQNSKLLYAID